MATKARKPAKKQAAPKKRGRPSKRTPEICAEICARLSRGEPLAVMCRDDHMPDPSTVWDWTEADANFSQDIARARERGFDAIAADCLTIANTPVEGVEVTTKASGDVEEKRGDMLGHRKLQIETRLKLLAKWDPKRYGDKIQQEHSGELTLVGLAERMRKQSSM